MSVALPPLYRGVVEALSATTLQPGMHAGLWYDKLYRAPDVDRREAKKKGHGPWIRTVTGTPPGNEAQLDETVGRRRLMVAHLGGRLIYARASSRFVTGLGRSHPVENGFAWHHTLGTPYLPGSSIKGVVRAWARMAGETPARIDALLGRPPRGEEPAQVGMVDLLDGLPTAPARLEVEVMTPHYGPYYQGGQVPGDWHSPVPIPFLVAAAKLTLQIGVVARSRGPEGENQAAVDTVCAWLIDALRELGAGAKTAVGYGRFEVVDHSELGAGWVAALEEQRRANASPLDRARAEVATLNPQQALDLLRGLSSGKGERSEEECAALRQALAEAYLDTWTKPDGMGTVGKQKRRKYLAWLKGET